MLATLGAAGATAAGASVLLSPAAVVHPDPGSW